MQITASSQKNTKNEVIYRVQIAIFMVLCLLLSNTVLEPVKNGVVYFTLSALLELFLIQAMFGLFNNTSLVRDANELIFYSSIIHLIAIPLYLNGVQSDWHNNAINGLLVLYLVRLFYFGEKTADGEYTGWAKFGALGWANHFIKKFANTATRQRALIFSRILITIATIVPLWAITAQTSDNKTSLFTILTTAFILIYGYWKNFVSGFKANEAEKLLNDETIPLCKAYNDRSSDARKIIQRIVVTEFSAPTNASQGMAQSSLEKSAGITSTEKELSPFISETEKIEALDRVIIGLVLGMAAIIALCAFSLHSQKKAMFEFGYASGYTDSKAGNKPQSETSFDKVFACHNRDWRTPPNKNCPAR
jgi:hypothetical protein